MDPLGVAEEVEKQPQELEKRVEDEEKRQLEKEENDDAKDAVGERHRGSGSPRMSSSGSDNTTKSADKSKRGSHIKPVTKAKDEKEAEEAAWAHLPEHEREIVRRQLFVPETKISYFTLYRYATNIDLVILAISAICAIIAGAVMPLMTVVFGGLSGQFAGFYQGTTGFDEFSEKLGHYTLYFVYIAIGEFVTVYINTVGFIYVGEHIAAKIREKYLAAILRQNIGFFDKLGAGEITTRITADTNQVQEGISGKVGLTLTAIATFVAAFVIAFIEFWKLALILMSTVVAIVVAMGTGSRWIVKYEKRTVAAFAEGGTVAEEVLSSIRNAVAFGTEDKLAKQYEKHLDTASTWGLKNKMIMALLWGSIFWIMYLSYALAFWMGSRFIVDGSTSLNKVITVSFAVIIGAFSLGNIAPNAQAFTSATAAAAKIFSTIDRESPLDPTVDTGKQLEEVSGKIELRNIRHIYPSRAEVVVMDNVNLIVPSGKTTALVGASGSGKSTIVGLVERFYDPVGGEVLLDDVNIQELNLKWLRQQISLVSQEPTLFSTTIEENIRHGLLGTKYEHASPEEQKQMVETAAKMANAHQFIVELPEGYETNVGARGFLLSGGQKQRIAIARAMVSDPKILLLDEATSALDTKSEGVVQAALDVAAKGRTTIVIAHRLSTIRDADNIVVMSEGRIVEQGTHNELLSRSGSYSRLVEAQKIAAKKEREAAELETLVDEKDEEIYRTLSRKKSKGYSSDPDDENLRNKLDRTVTGVSVSSKILKGRPVEGETKYSLWTLIKLTAAFNRKEAAYMLFGLFWSIIAGAGNPTQSVFFAEIILSMAVPPPYPNLREKVDFWCWMYFMLAFVQLLSMALQGISFAFCSQRLIYRARSQAFRSMLRQDITFFDHDENSAGALTSFLSTETNHLAGLSGSTLGTILMTSTTLIAAMIVGLALAWRLALVCIACIPLMVGAGFFRFWLLARFQSLAKKSYEASANYACEATSAIRTVASLTREQDVWDHYHESLVQQQKRSLKSISKSSILYAASQSIMFLVMALGFWYGGTRLAKGEVGLLQFFIAFSSIVFGAQSAGTIFSFAPDMGKAKQAADGLKTLFDRKPEIDTWSSEGEKITSVEGTLEFRDVHFRYPTRPEQPVLRGLNLTVKPGQYVALVGASGCGKSTTIALLERFYDALAGGVFIDGKDVATLNVNEYRKHLSLVSQEPTLYQGTIRENILLGSTGDDSDISDERIDRACREANIYDFIMSLPDGFSTVVGSKGSMLSGGQKQRIAIARALLRDPKILLLDEATSALDSESEKVVQAALDAAAKGRTTIAVAHRLSTIQKADMIYVFDQGKIVENGTHDELLKINGKYAELVNLQSLDKKQ